jgi:hypothetical protein
MAGALILSVFSENVHWRTVRYVRTVPERPEGWPLLTVEIEVMGTQRVQMKGVPLCMVVRWARRAGTRDFYPALAALVSPVQNIFFLTVHCCISIYVSSSPSKLAGSRAGPPVSECVSPVPFTSQLYVEYF